MRETVVPFHSGPYLVTAQHRRTTAMGWKDIKVGDIIRFQMNLKKTVKGRGIYASYIDIYRFGVKIHTTSQNNFINAVSAFELEKRT